jgi:hypothetical protein
MISIKKICFILVVFSLARLPLSSAEVLFQDTFEAAAIGSAPAAEIGSWSISLEGAAVVDDTFASEGSKALKVTRLLGGTSPSIRGFAVSASVFEAGYDFVFKADYYQENFYPTTGFYVHPPDGTGGFEGGWNTKRFSPPNYHYAQPTGPGWSYQFIDTGFTVLYGQWVTMEMVMHIVDSSTAGYVTGTYDLYMTPAGGIKTLLAADIAMRLVPNSVGNTIRFGIWPDAPEDYEWGGDVINYWDNISIEKITTPLCGDDEHPYPYADLNQDCIVDLNDLAVISDNWLACTYDCVN